MKNSIERIQKITSKGQITLPSVWRKKTNPYQILVRSKGEALEIFPIHLKKCMGSSEYTVFDALRDNKGKGLKAKDLLNILKKVNKISEDK